MSGKGPPPKPRRNRKRDEKPAVRMDSKVKAGPPALPQPDKLLPATATWWETWRQSEQAQHFTPTDWQRLLFLVPLVDAYWREPSKDLLGEIRLNESKLGATPEDRLRLRWKIEPPAPPAPRKRRYDGVDLEP